VFKGVVDGVSCGLDGVGCCLLVVVIGSSAMTVRRGWWDGFWLLRVEWAAGLFQGLKAGLFFVFGLGSCGCWFFCSSCRFALRCFASAFFLLAK
jgi:hypothetical protein